MTLVPPLQVSALEHVLHFGHGLLSSFRVGLRVPHEDSVEDRQVNEARGERLDTDRVLLLPATSSTSASTASSVPRKLVMTTSVGPGRALASGRELTATHALASEQFASPSGGPQCVGARRVRCPE